MRLRIIRISALLVLSLTAACLPLKAPAEDIPEDIRSDILPKETSITQMSSNQEGVLTERRPGLEKLQRYFETYDDPSLMLDDSLRLEDDARLTYKDLNGDQEPDLIIEDHLQASILIWQGSRYAPPYSELRLSQEPEACSRVLFEDWTGDQVPELIFDYRSSQGSNTYPDLFWDRTVIHCSATGCREVWSGRLASYGVDERFGGLDRFETRLERNTTEDRAGFLLRTRMFSFYSEGNSLPPEVSLANQVISYLNVYTNTRTSFQWNGLSFEQDVSVIEEPMDQIPGRYQLSADSPEGISAFIIAESNGSQDRFNDVCSLYVQDQPAEAPFGCKRNFTTLEWKDVTGDGQAEIVIQALSAPNPLDRLGRVMNEVDCPHQRLLVYKWADDQVESLADITGCVAYSSLFGVQIENWQDGWEIQAVGTIFARPEATRENGCWYELDPEPEILVYGWDGEAFSQRTPVP